MMTVQENKYYKPNEVRHWHGSNSLKASVSGQFSKENFPTLCEKIISTWEKQIPYDQIVFIDTRQDTHFELNDRVVAIESDNNAGSDAKEIMDREKTLCEQLVGKTVNWVKKERILEGFDTKKVKKETLEIVKTACTTFQFVENAGSNYILFPIEEHGPLTDAQLEEFLTLINTPKWLHFNSKVGVSAGILLIVIKDIHENATKDALHAILGRHDKKGHLSKDPKPDDENGVKKLARRNFIHQFYNYCRTKEQHHLSWPDWKEKTNLTFTL